MLTKQQIDWATAFLSIDIAPPINSGVLDAPGSVETPADAPPNADVSKGASVPAVAGSATPGTAAPDAGEKVGAIPIIPIIVIGVKTLTNVLSGKVTITNNTKFSLTLDTSSLKLESGEFQGAQPKGLLKGDGDHTEFTVVSKSIGPISIGEVEGTIRYFVGDQKTVWSCHFHNPRFIKDPLGVNSADAKVEGPNSSGLQQPPAARPTPGSDGTSTFSLDGTGGDQPDPPNNGGGIQLSCRVAVVNQTQQTVFLRKQDNAAGGDFVTDPAKSLAPGASTQFVYAETQNSKNHNCRGTMSWDIGDPKLGAWSMMWDNQRGAKNLSASFLDPNNGTFHTLDQIDNGDENVPVTFTLSGGGVGPGPKPGGTTVACNITVINQSDQPMKSAGSGGESGTFQSPPPAAIAPGAQAQFVFNGPTDDPGKGAEGFVQWIVGEKDDAAWLINWDRPAQGGSKVDGKVLPDGTGLNSSASVSDAADGSTAMTFTLSGKRGQQPTPTTTQHFVVAINNKSDTDIQLAGSPKTTGGKLKSDPPGKLAAGTTAQIDFVPDPAASAQASGGTMEWKVDPDGKTVWDLTWTIQPNGDAHADAVVAPPGGSFTSDAKTIPVDDGAGLVYTLSGSGGQQPVQPDDEFAPPPKSKQPTLRVGDESPDGWIEYAQRLLNKWANSVQIKGVQKDPVNGKFDEGMKTKVLAFQSNVKCKSIDGVIGNETWSLLREAKQEAVGTDGRQPHSFEQTDAQGRFATERTDVTGYVASDDHYFMFVVSTGEKPIDDFHATVKITQPDGTSHTHKVPIGKVTSPSGDGQGDFHTVLINSFKRTFNIPKEVEPTTCTVDAYLDKEIGGDRFTGPVTGPDPNAQPQQAAPPVS